MKAVMTPKKLKDGGGKIRVPREKL